MGKKTIWTVAAGTTAAVLVPGVAYALMAGGSDGPQQAPGIVGGEQRAVQPGEGPEHGAGADAGRSEERRVGKERRAGGSADRKKKNCASGRRSEGGATGVMRGRTH